MKSIICRVLAFCIAFGSIGIIPLYSAPTQTSRVELNADAGWRFLLGDPSGAEAPHFADGSWRTVNLPHDWSIEGGPDKSNATGSGGGFFPAGTGWYRKTFSAPQEWKGKRVSVEFNGVYKYSTVYLNGYKLGIQPYGYTSFSFDLTKDFDFSGPNVLAVRVDNSEQPNSRWYSGSGIYRHVRVVVTDPTRVAHWSVFVTTPEVSDRSAKISLRARVANESAEEATVTVKTTLIDRAGKPAGSIQSTLTIAPGSENESSQQIAVSNPAAWSPESPRRYRAVTQVLKNGKVADEVTNPFGIRSLSWSVEKGLLLNGKVSRFSHAVDLSGDAWIFLIDARGHTPGHLSLLVSLPEGPLVLTGDTVQTRRAFLDAIPSGNVTNPQQAQDAADRILMLQREFPNLRLFYGHDRLDAAAARRPPRVLPINIPCGRFVISSGPNETRMTRWKLRS